MNKEALVVLKSFGDLMIAINSLSKSQNTNLPELLLGSHLLPLLDAIGYESMDYHVIDTGASVPALFNIRIDGAAAGIISFLKLRRELSVAGFRSKMRFIVESADFREWLVFFPRDVISLPRANNIYLAYQKYLINNPVDISISPRLCTKILICPESRVSTKCFNEELIEKLLSINLSVNMRSTLAKTPKLKLNKSTPESDVLTISTLNQLAAAIKDSDLIVSADSLPAHLAEFYQKPCFVFSPIRNDYWLPLSSYVSGSWSLFSDDYQRYLSWLTNFSR